MAKKMSDEELAGILTGYIEDARQFDSSELSLRREWAIRMYDGEVDIEPQPGRSKVVSSDIADALEWTLAGLQRVLTASEHIVIYEPEHPEDEDGAAQATDGINYIFLKENDGFKVLRFAIHDGLLHGNGPLKVWWEGKPEYKVETIRGLTEMEAMAIATEPDVDDILEFVPHEEGEYGGKEELNEVDDKGETPSTEPVDDAY
jgi:hypothetical protein